jgi:signal transduction histidine kinase
MKSETDYDSDKPVRLLWLRCLAVLAPVAFLAVVGYLVRGPFHEQLHHYPGFVYLLVVLTVCVSFFTLFIFGTIRRAEHSLIERNQQLSALLRVGRAASSSLHVEDVLEAGLSAILAVTSSASAEVWLVDNGKLTLARAEKLGVGRTSPSIDESLLTLAVERGSPIDARTLGTELHLVEFEMRKAGFLSFYAQPLIRSGRVLGVLAVASPRPADLTSGPERRLLDGIAEQIAIAIENAQLHEQVIDATVLEERERLAHELHDGLAQVLGYVNTQALAIDKLITSGRGTEARKELLSLRDAVRGVYGDVREAILGLRSAHDTLVPSLRSYVVDLERMMDTSVTLKLGEGTEAVHLAAPVEIQLIRIVQEALSNVRKHAHAREATVRIDVEDHTLFLQVIDDGRGFDVARPIQTGWPQFGLRTMEERAHAIGGTFELRSSPERGGTTVSVTIPVATFAEVPNAHPAR